MPIGHNIELITKRWNMKQTIIFFTVGILVTIFVAALYSFAAEERITLTTYYPSPYGIYKELRADQMAIGSGYRNIPLNNDGWLIVNGSVGIGTNSPTAKLEVAGQVKITGGNPGASKVLTSDAAGLASWQSPVVPRHGTGQCYSESNNYCTAATVTGSDCIFGITGFDSAGGCETGQHLMDIWCTLVGNNIRCRSLRDPGSGCDSATIGVSWMCFSQ